VRAVLGAAFGVRAKGYGVRMRALARLLIQKKQKRGRRRRCDASSVPQSLAVVSSPTARAPTRVLSSINPAPIDADGDRVSPRRK